MKSFLTFISLFIFSTAIGQRTEYRVALNSGLFHFAGASATSTSSFNESDVANGGYTNNPYGSRNGLCYGLSLNMKGISRKNLIYGMDLGFELLQSKVHIDRINGFDLHASYSIDATGSAYLQTGFLNVNPFMGYRFNLKRVSCDLAGGFDFAWRFKAHEQGKATDSYGTQHTTSVDRRVPNFDLRPRIQVNADYRRVGAYVGYSIGLANYKSGYMGGVNEAYARLFRFGLTYQLK